MHLPQNEEDNCVLHFVLLLFFRLTVFVLKELIQFSLNIIEFVAIHFENDKFQQINTSTYDVFFVLYETLFHISIRFSIVWVLSASNVNKIANLFHFVFEFELVNHIWKAVDKYGYKNWIYRNFAIYSHITRSNIFPSMEGLPRLGQRVHVE